MLWLIEGDDQCLLIDTGMGLDGFGRDHLRDHGEARCCL